MLCDYTTGWLAGVASLLVGHPLDTIKIQQQLHGISFGEAAKKVKRLGGWRGFYAGLLAPLLAFGALNGLFFGIYGDVRDYLVKMRMHREGYSSSEDELQLLAPEISEKKNYKRTGATYTEMFISGTVAGTVSLALTAPVELVKTKLQDQMKHKTFKGPWDCMRTVVKDAGFRGMFRGILPMAIRDGPGGGGYFVVYHGVKDTFENPANSALRNLFFVQFLGGGCAGIVSWVVVLPFDTIKTRMQADSHLSPHFKSMSHCGREIVKADGIIGLYRGFWSCAARAFPVNAIIFVVYEALQKTLCRLENPPKMRS